MRSYDVIVIGGGLIGGSIAWRLAQCNLRVALFERNDTAIEASWAGAGMLSPVPDCAASIPLVPFGRVSLSLYPDFVAELEELTGCRTGHRREGTIELLFSADAERELSTLVALHHGLGFPSEPLPVDEARRLEPCIGREVRAAAFLPYEGSVDNRALAATVLAAAAKAGVELHTGTLVTRLLREGDRCTGVQTAADSFATANVVVAAGAASSQIEGFSSPVPTRPVRGQMIALHNFGGPVRRVLRRGGDYLVPRDDASPQRLVAGSTIEEAGFEKRVTPRGLEHILSSAQELAPSLGDAEIIETWSGLRPGTPDHLPILGPGDLEGLTFATGHYRNGILLTPITAELVREWITERRTSMDWEIFSPLRFAERVSETEDECPPRAVKDSHFSAKSSASS